MWVLTQKGGVRAAIDGMDVEKAKKLMRLAIDSGASDEEADTAARMLFRGLRLAGVTFEQMVRGLAGVEIKTRTVFVPTGIDGADCRMPWGKYRGVRLIDVFERDPGYVEWMVGNADRLPQTLKRAAEELIENA